MGLFNRRKKSPEPTPPAAEPQPWKEEIPWGTQYGGRELGLPAPLAVESAPVIAEWFVGIFAEDSDVDLDFSLRSLADVDSILTHFEERGSERTAEVTAASGFYAGEVLVRTLGLHWVLANDFPELNVPEVLNYAVVSPHGSGTYNIVNKAFKRVENGDEDSIAFFARAIVAQENAARG
ncbi:MULTISPECIES: hypothetical protein [unclassified Microbacterium]|uniref:hypothetical protein n=1 Tax=unclassified Microbacterium TaxID=2609290 RepID=UPI000682EF01|nr:hypothetical protein [Microbacterium sp. GCS4]